MRRTALALIALCALSACADRSSTTSPIRAISEPPSPSAPVNRQSVRGILRLAEESWMLETSDDSFIWLVGGPVETYPELEGKEVIVVGVYSDGSLVVDSCSLQGTELVPRT